MMYYVSSYTKASSMQDIKKLELSITFVDYIGFSLKYNI